MATIVKVGEVWERPGDMTISILATEPDRFQYRIEHYNFNPWSAGTVNWSTHPDLDHGWVCVKKAGPKIKRNLPEWF